MDRKNIEVRRESGWEAERRRAGIPEGWEPTGKVAKMEYAKWRRAKIEEAWEAKQREAREAEKLKLSLPIKRFEDMGLSDELLRGLLYNGFVEPSAVQQRGVRPIIEGHDVIIQSPSCTGKTAVFCIGAINKVDNSERYPQVLILSPTRELAEQNQKVCMAIGEHCKVTMHVCIDGRKMGDDIRAFEAGLHIVSGTPGRLMYMIQEKHFTTRDVKLLILDDADEMLNRVFKDQVYDIYRYLPPKIQVVVVSATLPHEVLEMTNSFMNDPVHVHVNRDELPLERFRQFFVSVEKEQWKFDTLTDLYATLVINQAVIFCNTKAKVEWLAEQLTKNNYTVLTITRDLTEDERDEVMRRFRGGEARVLVSSDIIGQRHESLVINYDIPNNREVYYHRIRRSGRFGRNGVAINFVKSDDIRILRDIEEYYGIQIDEMPMQIPDLA